MGQWNVTPTLARMKTYHKLSISEEPIVPTVLQEAACDIAAEDENVAVLDLDSLSEQLRLSKQTLVRWIDRHLIEATLKWRLDDENEGLRIVEMTPGTLKHLVGFANGYREDLVSCAQARRMLKIIDRKKVKRMIRAEDIITVEVEGERRVIVGSIEDYLIDREGEA